MNSEGSQSSIAPRAMDDDYIAHFEKLGDQELISAFNCEVGNTGWTSSRASYLAALHSEFKHRGFDCTAIGGDHSFSLRNKIRLSGRAIEVLDGSVA